MSDRQPLPERDSLGGAQPGGPAALYHGHRRAMARGPGDRRKRDQPPPGRESRLHITQGTFVSSDDHITRTPGDRIRGRRPVRAADNETVTLNVAEIVLAPNYVAELLGIDPGSMVIRREEITALRGRPRMLAVDWIPTSHVMAEAELLGPPTPEGPAHVIETLTGRRVTHAQDHLEGREADSREAAALGSRSAARSLRGARMERRRRRDPLWRVGHAAEAGHHVLT